MSPVAGGAARAQPAANAALAPAAIASPEPDHAAPPLPPENQHDPAAQPEGSDPGNAAARKTVWNVPPPPPDAAPPGGIIGGDASWPSLVPDSARAWSKSASSDSLKCLSDGSGPSTQEDLVVPSQPAVDPISSNLTSTFPPLDSTAQWQLNSSTNQPNITGHGGGNDRQNEDGNRGIGSSGGRSADSDNSGGDSNWNNGGLGHGSSSNGTNGGASNVNSDAHSGSNRGSGTDSNRRVLGNYNSNGNGNAHGSGSTNNGFGRSNGSNRNNGGVGNTWNSNGRNSSGGSNGFGGRGSWNRRDHERGGAFSPGNYPRPSPVPHQQQQPGVYQPGSFHLPPQSTPYMVTQPFLPYVPQFAYPADIQGYPYGFAPIEQQFQNMHLVQPQMQLLPVHQNQQNLQRDIREQIEFYFSTNNLCHDTFLRRQMNDQGWVHIGLLVGFNRMRRFTDMGLDANYILESIQASEEVEVQGHDVRRRNDWAHWVLR